MKDSQQRIVVSAIALIGGFASLTFLVQRVRSIPSPPDPYEDRLKRWYK